MTSLSDIFSNHPSFAYALIIFLVLLGVFSATTLSVQEYPALASNAINITTQEPSASAESIEAMVTLPIENAAASVAGVDYISSTSRLGESSVTLYFYPDTPIENALNAVTRQMAASRTLLPGDAYDPVIREMDPMDAATIFLTFKSQTLSPEAVTDYFLRTIKPTLLMISGVSEAQLFGERERALRLSFNLNNMRARQLSLLDVLQAIRSNQVLPKGGLWWIGKMQYPVSSQTDLSSIDAFNSLIIRNVNGTPIYLKDIGKAFWGTKDENTLARSDGESVLEVGLVPRPDISPLALSQAVRKKLSKIQTQIPRAIHMNLLFDTTTYVRASLFSVLETFLETLLCVSLIIFLCVGAWRATTVPLLIILLSLFGACVLLKVLGGSLNSITLLAFVLAISIVVDDVIVMLENIDRHLSYKSGDIYGAQAGAREIQSAVIVMTATLIAIFIPIGFSKGVTGNFFRAFAWTMASAIFFSGFLTLSIAPFLCEKFLTTRNLSSLTHRINYIFLRSKKSYHRFLIHVMPYRRAAIFGLIIFYILGFFLAFSLPRELAPLEDKGYFFGSVSAPTATNLSYLIPYTSSIEQNILQRNPDIDHYLMINGIDGAVNQANFLVVLKDWRKRKVSALQVASSIDQSLNLLPGVSAFTEQPPALPGATSLAPVVVMLKTTGDYSALSKAASDYMNQMNRSGLFKNVRTNFISAVPKMQIQIDRLSAARLHISLSDINDMVAYFFGEPEIGYFTSAGRAYSILPERLMVSPNVFLQTALIHTQNQSTLPLSTVANMHYRALPDTLFHFQNERAFPIVADLAQNVTFHQATQFLKKIPLAENIQLDFAGQLRRYNTENQDMFFILAGAFIFVFLIWLILFENFKDPLIVLFSSLLSPLSAIDFMFLGHMTLNIYTLIGLLIVTALGAKNSILIILFARDFQAKHAVASQIAMRFAARVRLRPILMTSVILLLGVLPLLFSRGPGFLARVQIGFVIATGISLGTLLNLWFVPILYESLRALKFGRCI